MGSVSGKGVALLVALAALSLAGAPAQEQAAPGVVVNDVHSRLNETRVQRVETPGSLEAIQAIVRQARAEKRAISIAGGRHAMGAQQFGTDTILVDMGRMDRVLGFDHENGILAVQAGIRWPELLEHLARSQAGKARTWGIRQKQTGADRLSIGGALSANAHGRGLRFKPIVGDVESFTLVDADAKARRCSRTENPELFRLAIGGYGLFGVIADVKLRLVPPGVPHPSREVWADWAFRGCRFAAPGSATRAGEASEGAVAAGRGRDRVLGWLE